MNKLTISFFGNQIFSEIINEIKLFSKFKLKFYDNLDLCIKCAVDHNQLVIFFATEANQKYYKKVENNSFPLLVITKSSIPRNILSNDFIEQLIIPFSILNLEKKIVSLIARYKFRKSSLINLCGYTIDKNERKIKKNSLELQLSEKEINFLILFSKNKEPINRNVVLKNVWRYSEKSETHTIETHIHRLRKKIFEKFGDNNFIKNNNKGYYIWKKNHVILLLKIFLLLNIKKELLNQKKEKEALKEKNVNSI